MIRGAMILGRRISLSLSVSDARSLFPSPIWSAALLASPSPSSPGQFYRPVIATATAPLYDINARVKKATTPRPRSLSQRVACAV